MLKLNNEQISFGRLVFNMFNFYDLNNYLVLLWEWDLEQIILPLLQKLELIEQGKTI